MTAIHLLQLDFPWAAAVGLDCLGPRLLFAGCNDLLHILPLDLHVIRGDAVAPPQLPRDAPASGGVGLVSTEGLR